MTAAPLWLLRPQRRRWRLGLPVLAVMHALATFAVLRGTVPLAMIHKVIGSPVLAWGGPWEDIARYVALHLAVMLPLYGAALLVRTVQHAPALVDFVHWCFVLLLLAWPLHWALVERAGTDNLVELMRGGGSPGASAALGAAWMLVAVAGSAVAAAAAPRRRALLLALAALALALALAPSFFSVGLKPVLVKYGKAFSALQFIVSAGRDSYAGGPELALRAALALVLPVLLMAALQAPQWRTLVAMDAARAPRRPGRHAGLAAA